MSSHKTKYRKEYDLQLIGRNLRRLREARQLSVKEVSEYLYLGSVQAVYKYENGRGYPQADTLLALMDLYGVRDIREILEEPNEGEAREASPSDFSGTRLFYPGHPVHDFLTEGAPFAGLLLRQA